MGAGGCERARARGRGVTVLRVCLQKFLCMVKENKIRVLFVVTEISIQSDVK